MDRRTLTLTDNQQQRLEEIREHDPRPYMRERAAALLKIQAGQSAYAVALYGLLKRRDPDTVYSWLDRFQAHGLDSLVIPPRHTRRVPP